MTTRTFEIRTLLPCTRLLNTPSSSFKFRTVIFIVFAFLVLRRSAAYFGIPSSFGIPPLYGGELAIILFTILYAKRRTVAGFIKNPIGFASFLFAGLSIPYILAVYNDVGVESFMYASVSYYAVFVYFGYAVVHTNTDQDNFIRLFYYALLLSNCHALLGAFLPLREISPLINGTPLLGNGGSAYIYFSLGIGYAIVYNRVLGRTKSMVLLLLSIAAHVIGMERGSLVAIIAIAFLLLWYRKIWWRHSRSLFVPAFFVLVFSGIISVCYFSDSRLTQNVKSQYDAALSVIGKSDFREGTRLHRLKMWDTVVQETIHRDILFGQGFREPLIEEESFRGCHNSFITIFGYMGLLGLSLASILYMVPPLLVALKLRNVGSDCNKAHLLFYLCFVISFFGAAFFGTTLVSPYSALVCNFIYGAFLRSAELNNCIANSRTKSNLRNAVASYSQ